MESTTHLLVPFAAVSAPDCRALMPGLHLPHLGALLAELRQTHTQAGNDDGFSPPHETALADALRLGRFADGCIPWAAVESQEVGAPQAWFSPCHFQIGMDQISLQSAEHLGLGDADARPLFDALAPFCAEDGITLHYENAGRWRAVGEPLRSLRCASLDRVVGRSVADWTDRAAPDDAGAQLLKRLQSEAQMLFYTHAVNDRREAARLPIVNGFWAHGAGVLAQPLAPAPAITQPDGLRQAALQGDWLAWQQAWQALDTDSFAPLRERVRNGLPLTLTLCGERNWTQWATPPSLSLGQRLGRWAQSLRGPAPAWKFLETL